MGILKDFAKEFSRALEKCSSLTYGEADRRNMDSALRAVCSALGEDLAKGMKSKVINLFLALQSRADLGIIECEKEFRCFLDVLHTADSIAPEIEQSRQLKMILTNSKHIQARSIFLLSAELRKFGGSSSGQVEFTSIGVSIDVLARKMDDIIRIMDLLCLWHTKFKIAPPDELTSELAILDVVRDFSLIRNMAKDGGFSQDLQDGVNHIETLYDVAQLGAKAYSEKEIMFKSTTTNMVKAIMKMQQDISGGKMEAEKFSQDLADISLSFAQLAVWSLTPAHDRCCVEFVEVLGVIARLGYKAVHLVNCVPADYQPDATLHAAMKAVCTKETSKPKLLWLLGDELTMAFLTFADAMFEAVGPANADHAQDQSGNPCLWGTASSAAYFKKP